jgi:hypothetical protein
MKTLARAVLLGAVMTGAAAHADLSATPKVAATQVALRDLWVGHIFWVRNVAMATMSGNKEEAKVAEEEVVANAKQIAAALEPYYAKAGSDKMFTLLAGHWGAVKEHMMATQKGDAKGQEAAMKKMTANVEEIATFLSGANPNLPKETLVGLFTAHVGHHAQQNAQLKAKKYADEAKTWEAMKNHMYVVADALGEGIAKQFPDKFSMR